MACATCAAAEALCREHSAGAAPWCLIQPHVAALFLPKMLRAEKLGWRWGVLRDLLLTPWCCFSYKTQGQRIQLSLTGALQAPCTPAGAKQTDCRDHWGIQLPLSALLSA